jgi:hypothetical protein
MQVLQRIVHFLLALSPRDVAGLIIIFTLLSSWIIGIQMRRKIRRDLGRKATELDLTSVDTWMKVDEVEEQSRRNNRSDPK